MVSVFDSKDKLYPGSLIFRSLKIFYLIRNYNFDLYYQEYASHFYLTN